MDVQICLKKTKLVFVLSVFVLSGNVYALIRFDLFSHLSFMDKITFTFLMLMFAFGMFVPALQSKGVLRKARNTVKELVAKRPKDFRDTNTAKLLGGLGCIFIFVIGLVGGKLSHAGSVWGKEDSPITYFLMLFFFLSFGCFNLYMFWKAAAKS